MTTCHFLEQDNVNLSHSNVFWSIWHQDRVDLKSDMAKKMAKIVSAYYHSCLLWQKAAHSHTDCSADEAKWSQSPLSHEEDISNTVADSGSNDEGFDREAVWPGVVRRILHLLYCVTKPRKLSIRQKSELSTRLVELRNEIPSEMARKPRDMLNRWKSTELCQLCLYTGPVVLDGLVEQDVSNQFLSGSGYIHPADHWSQQEEHSTPILAADLLC